MPYGVATEFRELSAVLLHRPGRDIAGHPRPAEIDHLGPIEYETLSREFDAVAAAFVRHGVRVVWIDAAPLGSDLRYRYNMMYCRDLFFMTPRGAVLSSMARDVRREEVRYAERTLAAYGIPIVHAVSDGATFEGADALWISERLVVVGTGKRTNDAGFRQIRTVLGSQNVDCVAVSALQERTQHLLGIVQIVDRDLALLREEIAGPEIRSLLERSGITVVPVPESGEVTSRQAMNIVTVAPRTVMMTAGCPGTRALYERAGITVAEELELTQLMRGAGGLACAAGIIGRGPFPPLP